MSDLHIVLCIETSTHNCSVAVFRNDALLACAEESSDQYIHGESLHLFIQQALTEASIDLSELSAIGVSIGPGSYTGLRIGVSAVKGMAFTLQIPIYAMESLEVLAYGATDEVCGTNEVVLSVIDARRMEVYAAMFDKNANKLTSTEAIVVESDSFEEWRKGRKVVLAGDAQTKLMDVLSEEDFRTSEVVFPSARFMIQGVLQKIQEGKSEDVAYFEPYYLKDFMAGKPRKSPLNL